MFDINKKQIISCYERLSTFIILILSFLGAIFVYTDAIGEGCVFLKKQKIWYKHPYTREVHILKFFAIYAIITKN